MGRRIKFRAWDKEAKEMLFWENDRDSIMQAIPIDCGDEWTERCEVMQFTGLKDKNGKEVFEGDVVKARDKYNDIDNDSLVWGSVEWWGSYLCWGLKGFKRVNSNGTTTDGHDCVGGLHLYQIEILQVIGNIFENPDLLKEIK